MAAPQMDVAVGQTDAARVLISLYQCVKFVAGVPELLLGKLIKDDMERLGTIENFCIAMRICVRMTMGNCVRVNCSAPLAVHVRPSTTLSAGSLYVA